MQKTPLDHFIKLLPQEGSYLAIRALLDQYPPMLTFELLNYAIVANQKDVVQTLLFRGADVNTPDRNGLTALHLAAKDKSVDIFKLLLCYGAKQFNDNTIKTPFLIALENAEFKVLTALLEEYSSDYDLELIKQVIADKTLPDNIRFAAYLYFLCRGELIEIQTLAHLMNFNYCDSHGNNAVLVAAGAGRLDVLGWLVNVRGLSIDVTNKEKNDVVLVAIAKGQRKLLRELVKSKSDQGFGRTLAVCNAEDLGPVLMAIENNQLEILDELIRPNEKSASSDMSGHGLSLNVKACGYGPVMIAAIKSHPDTFCKLVSPTPEGYGLDINATNSDGLNVVLAAARYGRSKLFKELVKPKIEGGKYGLAIDVQEDNNDVVIQVAKSGNTEFFAELLKPRSKKGYGLSINVKGKYGWGVVHAAISEGRIKLLKEMVTSVKQGGYGLTLKVVDKFGRGPVLVAIAFDQIKVLDLLIAPAPQGYGLTLNVKDSEGLNPVQVAATFSNYVNSESIFAKLVTPKENKGYGFTLKPNSADAEYVVKEALRRNEVKLLEKLLKPTSEGGFQLRAIISYSAFHKDNKEATVLCHMCHFNEFLIKDFNQALVFAGKTIQNLKFAKQEFIDAMIVRYKELIEFYLKSNLTSEAGKISDSLETLSPGAAHIMLGHYYSEDQNFIAAFESFLAAYQINDLKVKHEAAYQITNLILIGNIIMDSIGSIDKEQTMLQKNHLTECDLEKRKRQGLELTTMQDRAIKAYEYLHGDISDKAAAMRLRLDQILGDELSPQGQRKYWKALMLKKFQQYYLKKNPELLTSTFYVESLDNLFDQSIQSEAANAAALNSKKETYSPRFLNAAKLTPVDSVDGTEKLNVNSRYSID